MKTVVLEHPRIGSEKRFNDIANTPLWSCLMGGYAAAALEKAGFDVTFIDDATPGTTFEQSLKKILAVKPGILCVNAVYFWEHTVKLFDFFTNLKIKGFTGHINLFGFFPSLVYLDILGTVEAVDSVCVGEFEHTLAELADFLKKGGVPDQIPGLATRSHNGINIKHRPPEKNPDRFAFPKRIPEDSTVTILASRGCYNRCSFCLVPAFDNSGGLWRGRSPENIFREIEQFVAKGTRDFYFSDPNFIGPGRAGKKRVHQLLELIKPLNITFGMETRPNDLDDEIIEDLVRSGMTSFLMGIESGSANVLRLIGKSSTTAVATRAIRLCRDHGIDPEIGFLMFVPDGNLGDLRDNIAFLQENNLLDRLDRTANLLCHKQIVLAGTSGYRYYAERGCLLKDGIFGFEGEVSLSDPKVEWVAKLVIFACHTILKSMSDIHSPIFWQKKVSPVFMAANKYLVELFINLLVEAETEVVPAKIPARTEEIDRDIREILNQQR
ncbi:MAG: radical SAM protein [Desulforhopalus sp.]